jgi:hypothetical protein
LGERKRQPAGWRAARDGELRAIHDVLTGFSDLPRLKGIANRQTATETPQKSRKCRLAVLA